MWTGSRDNVLFGHVTVADVCLFNDVYCFINNAY